MKILNLNFTHTPVVQSGLLNKYMFTYLNVILLSTCVFQNDLKLIFRHAKM